MEHGAVKYTLYTSSSVVRVYTSLALPAKQLVNEDSNIQEGLY